MSTGPQHCVLQLRPYLSPRGAPSCSMLTPDFKASAGSCVDVGRREQTPGGEERASRGSCTAAVTVDSAVDCRPCRLPLSGPAVTCFSLSSVRGGFPGASEHPAPAVLTLSSLLISSHFLVISLPGAGAGPVLGLQADSAAATGEAQECAGTRPLLGSELRELRSD